MTVDKGLFDKGLKVRKEVLGAQYVENSIAAPAASSTWRCSGR